MNDSLPMCCRACAHKQIQYLYPAWTHRCEHHEDRKC